MAIANSGVCEFAEISGTNDFVLNIPAGHSAFINNAIYKGPWSETSAIESSFKYIQIGQSGDEITNSIPLYYLKGKYLNGPAIIKAQATGSGESGILVQYSLVDKQPFLIYVAPPKSTNSLNIPAGKAIFLSAFGGNWKYSIRGYEDYGLPAGWFINGPEEIVIMIPDSPVNVVGIFNYFITDQSEATSNSFEKNPFGTPFPLYMSPNLISPSAFAQQFSSTNNNYGIATKAEITNAISSATEVLATKTELTNALAQSRADGINSVLSNPNLWTLYTTNQIKNMAIGDLVLSKQVNGQFVLNYDIEQSDDLQTWTPYLSYALPMTNLPTDKAFVRIKAKQ